MPQPIPAFAARALLLAAAVVAPAYAHHPMGYTTPATFLEGLLSGFGHPILGVDHLIFILASGVLAARLRGGLVLPLAFVAASVLAVALRYGGGDWGIGEAWVAASLLVLGAVMIAVKDPARGLVAAIFAVSGAVHGYALAEAIVGAEATPLYAYLAGLAVIQYAIALAAAGATLWLARRRPQLATHRLAGAAVGVAGVYFTGLALLG